MRISSDTDLILTKLHRVKQIEDNKGKTLISEGVDGHYKDIINYSIFALIKLEEQKNKFSTPTHALFHHPLISESTHINTCLLLLFHKKKIIGKHRMRGAINHKKNSMCFWF